MTRKQYRFLKAIRDTDKSAEEICLEIGIQSEDRNRSEDLGGYYNALNKAIGYLVSDTSGEIDDCFEIISDNSPYANRDRYYITENGRNKFDQEKDRVVKNWIGIIGLVLTAIGIIVAIMGNINL